MALWPSKRFEMRLDMSVVFTSHSLFKNERMADDTSDFQLCPDPSTLTLEPLLHIPAPRSVVTCIARRGAGKSYLFSSWLYHQLRDPKRMYNKGNVIVFTSSGRLSNDFSYLSPENVRPFSEQTFTSVMRLQQRRITLLKKRA